MSIQGGETEPTPIPSGNESAVLCILNNGREDDFFFGVHMGTYDELIDEFVDNLLELRIRYYSPIMNLSRAKEIELKVRNHFKPLIKLNYFYEESEWFKIDFDSLMKCVEQFSTEFN